MARAGIAVALSTPRLLLCELREADLDATAELLGDPRVMRWWPAPATRAEARAWIARQRQRYARDGHGYWLVRERRADGSPGAPLGQAGLLALDLDGRAELGLGYLLRHDRWGRGLAREAAGACLDHAARLPGAPRVVALIRPENLPSRRLAARLGLALDGRTHFAGFEHWIFATAPRGEARARPRQDTPGRRGGPP